ncbi:MAG: hypothetical protein [Circular genetic element sp.]|nr:MAG: hypothetical protein [Circular genetic element sp.]
MKSPDTLVYRLGYHGGQALGLLGYGYVTGADIPTGMLHRYLPKTYAVSKGLSSTVVRVGAPPLGMLSAGQLWQSSGAMDRTIDVALQRGQEGAHWQNTPKQLFARRKTHGFFVSPRNRTLRSPSQDRWTGLQRDYASKGIVWMP